MTLTLRGAIYIHCQAASRATRNWQLFLEFLTKLSCALGIQSKRLPRSKT